MRDAFKGWRRKSGVVTLAMACVFMAGWLRSEFYTDHLLFPFLTCGNLLESKEGRIGWECSWWTKPYDKSTTYGPRWESYVAVGQSKTGAIGFAYQFHKGVHRGESFEFQTTDFDSWIFIAAPYWSIVVPPTMLSAWLLCGRPRQAKPVPNSVKISK